MSILQKFSQQLRLRTIKDQVSFWFGVLVILVGLLNIFPMVFMVHWLLTMMGLISIVVILLSLFIIRRLADQIEQPLLHVLHGAKVIEHGNYAYRIDKGVINESSMELRELCQTYNRMSEALRENHFLLEESEGRYRSLIELSPEMIGVHSKGKIVFLNPTGMKMIGIKDINEIIGMSIYDFVHPDFHTVLEKRANEIYKGRLYQLLIEEKFICKDGSIIDVEVDSAPIMFKGEPAAQFIARNVTERNRIQEELRNSREQYRLLVENLKEAVCQTDARGIWTFLNPAWTEITGFSIEESIGKNSLAYIYPRDREQNRKLLQPLIQRKNQFCRYEIRYLRKDGGFRWTEVTAQSVAGSNGEVVSISSTLLDITERKEAEEKIQEANKMLLHLSMVDGLTGIANRRYFDQKLVEEWKRAARYTKPLSLIMLDIDYFKLYNDTYGHQEGDDCLRKVASTLKETINRPGDMVARYGGEEFAVILPDIEQKGAIEVAEKIRSNIKRLEIPHITSKVKDTLTISVGVATIMPNVLSEQPAILISFADKALYQAKGNGRDQVQFYNKVNLEVP